MSAPAKTNRKKQKSFFQFIYSDFRIFLRKLKTAAPIILLVSIITILLSHGGLLNRFQTAAIDTWLRLKKPVRASEVTIVAIDQDDYKTIFDQRSPLPAPKLQDLIRAIALGGPRFIIIDLDTSHPDYRILREEPGWPPVLWAREGIIEEHRIELMDVFGGRADAPRWTGIATMPEDSDGIVRSYKREIRIPGHLESYPTVPWVAIRALGEKVKDPEYTQEKFLLNFAGGRKKFSSVRAATVLNAADNAEKSNAWRERGILSKKIVLLGATYRAARDEYVTPVGSMYGVELMAEALHSEMTGLTRQPSEALILALEIIGGMLFVLLYAWLHLSRALFYSLISLPTASLLCSRLAFGSYSYWIYFVPTLLAVLIGQLYDQARAFQEKKLHELATGE